MFIFLGQYAKRLKQQRDESTQKKAASNELAIANAKLAGKIKHQSLRQADLKNKLNHMKTNVRRVLRLVVFSLSFQLFYVIRYNFV